MKIALLLPLLLFLNQAKAQQPTDLYLHVDSLITHQIGYKPDIIKPQATAKSKSKDFNKGIIDFTTQPTYPLIMLNGHKVTMVTLNRYHLEDVKSLDMYGKEDSKIMALYGFSAKNGAIFIETIQKE